MRFNQPSGRRLSLPAIDMYGQPIYEPFLYHGPFQHYPNPHSHPHLLPPPAGIAPPVPLPHHPLHDGFPYPLEGYFGFNSLPEIFPEQQYIPPSPDTNPFPNSLPTQFPASREIIPADNTSTSAGSSYSIPRYQNSTQGDSVLSAVSVDSVIASTQASNASESPYSPPPSTRSSNSSNSVPPQSYSSPSQSSVFSFAESVPFFDVSDTETSGEPNYDSGPLASEMAVQFIPQPDTVRSYYDGSTAPAPASKHKYTANGNRQANNQGPNHPKQKSAGGRALVVNGSTNDPVSQIPLRAPRRPHGDAKSQPFRSNQLQEKPQPPGPQPQSNEVEPQTRSEAPIDWSETDPSSPVVPHSELHLTPGPPIQDLGAESVQIHLALSHLPHYNKLNNIYLRANHSVTANKIKLIDAAKELIISALHSHEATKNVNLGSWFSWTEKGVSINFDTNEDLWAATEHQEWLLDIGDGVRIGEKWGGIVIRDIWNPHIIDQVSFDEEFKRKLENLNPMIVHLGSKGFNETYRIRKMKWFGPSTLAIWFHDSRVADYFVEKGLWRMEGYVGIYKYKKVGVCGLRCVNMMVEQPRPYRRQFPQHKTDGTGKADHGDERVSHVGKKKSGGYPRGQHRQQV
ncbi:hypothetical protein TWF694_000465 [Orbilia ellipsospora]|uniref:Uncharacterized protein n=1 Tax=Orbilia ellipsospora TaxID=2528407 RepID=A0AAV9XQ35_9PEZI